MGVTANQLWIGLLDKQVRIAAPKELAEQVPGAEPTEPGIWAAPLSWATAVVARGVLGPRLEVAPALREWIATEYERRIRPAMEARGEPAERCCPVCGLPRFWWRPGPVRSVRRDRVYCSNACKQVAYYRRRDHPGSGPVRLGPRLARAFFARPPTVVAAELLGRVLVRVLPDGTRLAARLVEVEAYAPDDPASHSYRGRTLRNAAMFGPPGHLYVYQIHRHFCANVVTGSVGEGSAVLFRAAEPVSGLEVMAVHRGTEAPGRLCSGPGNLAQALAIARADDGADLVTGAAIQLRQGEPIPPARVVRTTRVGVRVGVEARWRYLERASPFVSRGRPSGTDGLGRLEAAPRPSAGLLASDGPARGPPTAAPAS